MQNRGRKRKITLVNEIWNLTTHELLEALSNHEFVLDAALLFNLAWSPSWCTEPILEYLMQHMSEDVIITIKDKETVLHCAATRNNERMVNAVLNRNKSAQFIGHLNLGVQKQKIYHRDVKTILLDTTPLIPVLIPIVGQYARFMNLT